MNQLLADLHSARIERLARMGGRDGRNTVPIERVRPKLTLAAPTVPPVPAPEPPPAPQINLEDIKPGTLRMDHIQRFVGDKYGVQRSDIISESRLTKFSFARQVAMYLCHRVLERSTTQIGNAFNRDHTTTLHAIKKIKHMVLGDTKFCLEIIALEEELRPYIAGGSK